MYTEANIRLQSNKTTVHTLTKVIKTSSVEMEKNFESVLSSWVSSVSFSRTVKLQRYRRSDKKKTIESHSYLGSSFLDNYKLTSNQLHDKNDSTIINFDIHHPCDAVRFLSSWWQIGGKTNFKRRLRITVLWVIWKQFSLWSLKYSWKLIGFELNYYLPCKWFQNENDGHNSNVGLIAKLCWCWCGENNSRSIDFNLRYLNRIIFN